ncbi:GNAT family N-acetyltransferase [Pedomonas mirosovicensis]|uniref:GNAT family N-acetyltransferase n=1 Tax=Pedomonas mirosovicensis TaxID=2908641 RepID=UPI00216869C8|nr:GNAT family N-acetyltransferase [Pedomonas mirosovicensis]MCH8685740.1 GNAT family N-acetyltransferase [Pedomonas mirosovicensis]
MIATPPAAEPVIVRPAIPDDVEAAAATLSAAFADYPWTRHTVAADHHVERLRQLQLLFLSRIALPYGRVWVTDDCEAVAVWSTPEGAAEVDRTFAELEAEFSKLAGDRAKAWEEAEAELAPFRPQEPVWLLATIGVDPSRQGQGLGTAVIRPGLKAAEAAGIPAYLETASLRNVAFYERLGFRVLAEVQLPANGPRTWCMMRRP